MRGWEGDMSGLGWDELQVKEQIHERCLTAARQMRVHALQMILAAGPAGGAAAAAAWFAAGKQAGAADA